jgi:hypothetical protein
LRSCSSVPFRNPRSKRSNIGGPLHALDAHHAPNPIPSRDFIGRSGNGHSTRRDHAIRHFAQGGATSIPSPCRSPVRPRGTHRLEINAGRRVLKVPVNQPTGGSGRAAYSPVCLARRPVEAAVFCRGRKKSEKMSERATGKAFLYLAARLSPRIGKVVLWACVIGLVMVESQQRWGGSSAGRLWIDACGAGCLTRTGSCRSNSALNTPGVSGSIGSGVGRGWIGEARRHRPARGTCGSHSERIERCESAWV